QLDRDLGVDPGAVDLLEHRARDLALAESLERDALAELAVRIAELLAHRFPRHLDKHLLLDRGNVFDAYLHGGTRGYHRRAVGESRESAPQAIRRLAALWLAGLDQVDVVALELAGQRLHERDRIGDIEHLADSARRKLALSERVEHAALARVDVKVGGHDAIDQPAQPRRHLRCEAEAHDRGLRA